jgi:hypothetical protein
VHTCDASAPTRQSLGGSSSSNGGDKIARKKKRRGKKSLISLARGAIYGLTLAYPAIQVWNEYGGRGMEAVGAQAALRYSGRDSNGNFSGATLAATYGPVVGWSIVDFGLSKLGVWKKIGRLLG